MQAESGANSGIGEISNPDPEVKSRSGCIFLVHIQDLSKGRIFFSFGPFHPKSNLMIVILIHVFHPSLRNDKHVHHKAKSSLISDPLCSLISLCENPYSLMKPIVNFGSLVSGTTLFTHLLGRMKLGEQDRR